MDVPPEIDVATSCSTPADHVQQTPARIVMVVLVKLATKNMSELDSSWYAIRRRYWAMVPVGVRVMGEVLLPLNISDRFMRAFSFRTASVLTRPEPENG